MDYRKFLGKTSSVTLPYFGGAFVHDASRRLRVSVEQPPGWYRFEISGRAATPVDSAEPADLSGLEIVRGHFAHGWLFSGGRALERIELLPEEEPPVLSPLTARRWHSGQLLFEAADFESEAEDLARRALEELSGIAEVKGVAASLRAAFGWALVARVAEQRQMRVSPREVMSVVLQISAGGRDDVERWLDEVEERRRLEQVRLEAWARAEAIVIPTGARSAWTRPNPDEERSPASRAAHALASAGAELLGSRSLGQGMLEVTYRFLGERFISVVDERTLQVFDAGICLSGEDRQVTLESLPSVIREGYDSGQLNITRH
jgi:hypothetical protein